MSSYRKRENAQVAIDFFYSGGTGCGRGSGGITGPNETANFRIRDSGFHGSAFLFGISFSLLFFTLFSPKFTLFSGFQNLGQKHWVGWSRLEMQDFRPHLWAVISLDKPLKWFWWILSSKSTEIVHASRHSYKDHPFYKSLCFS